MAEAYNVAATRTAGGRRNGKLAGWHPVHLGAAVLDEVVRRAGVPGDAIDDVIFGCVTQAAEQANNIGRNSVLASSLPEHVPAVTVDRQCGFSQQAIQFAAQAVMAGTMDLVIAAGAESMSRVPMGTAAGAIAGLDIIPNTIKQRFGVDSQFVGAEMIARKWGMSREDLDAFGMCAPSVPHGKARSRPAATRNCWGRPWNCAASGPWPLPLSTMLRLGCTMNISGSAPQPDCRARPGHGRRNSRRQERTLRPAIVVVPSADI